MAVIKDKSANGRFSSNRWLVIIGVILPIAYWLILIFELPLFKLVPGYFWHAMEYMKKSLPAIWLLIPLLVISAIAVRFILRKAAPGKWCLLVIIGLGVAFQMVFGFVEGRGIDDLRMRLVASGHAEFVHLAVKYKDMAYVAGHYEEFLQKSDTLAYAKTKPPGQLLFYMITQQVSEYFTSPTNPRDRFVSMITFSSFLFPVLSCMVLIPLFYIARIFTDHRTAIRACLIYIFVPSVTLVTTHLDQVLYPLMAMLTVATIVYGCKYNNRPAIIASGILLYLDLFVSFSLLPVALICLLMGGIIWRESQNGNVISRQFLMVLILWGAGFVVTWLLFWMFLNYNPVHRFQEAMAFHQQWKEWQPGLMNMILFALLNVIEFLCWMGLSLAVVYLSHTMGMARSIFAGGRDRWALFVAGYALILILMALFGRTKGEVNRLWIFMLPPICLMAARELVRRFAHKSDMALTGLVILQFITTLVIKRFQDFW